MKACELCKQICATWSSYITEFRVENAIKEFKQKLVLDLYMRKQSTNWHTILCKAKILKRSSFSSASNIERYYPFL